MKKYKVGFTAGTFDMFHIGHLNLLKSAKEQCDILVVGVNEDELVKYYKNKAPLITQSQRLEIVKGVRYVNEAYMMHSLAKKEAWDMFNFDVVFIGSDYKNSKRYQEEEVRMREIGVDIVYVPYTVGISSTILAKRIISNEVTNQFYKEELEQARRG